MDVDTRYDVERMTWDAHARRMTALTVVVTRRRTCVPAADRSVGSGEAPRTRLETSAGRAAAGDAAA